MSEKRRYRQFTPAAGRDRAGRPTRRSVGAGCVPGVEIAETLYHHWRDRLLDGGKAAPLIAT
ncbi:MAG: hypothetical protein WKF47_13740 [Geodermatophilaceae bacterium]|jgi:hypothetical protein